MDRIQTHSGDQRMGQFCADSTDKLGDTQVKRVFALARPGLLEAINPEMQALFRAVIYAFSIWINKQTPGNVFMNLICVNGHAPATPFAPRSCCLRYGPQPGQHRALMMPLALA